MIKFRISIMSKGKAVWDLKISRRGGFNSVLERLSS